MRYATALVLVGIVIGGALWADDGKLEPSKPTVEALILRLDADSFFVREEATQLLVERGRDAIASLETALKHPSAEVRSRAMLALGAIERAVLYTISTDGMLIELKAGKNSVQTRLIARLGAPFEADNVMVEGLAMSPRDGKLYAAVSVFEECGGISRLYCLNPDGTSVKYLGELANTEIDGLAFDRNGTLLGMISSEKAARENSLGQLVRIDTESAAIETVSEQLELGDADALAISADGSALVSNQHSVYEAVFEKSAGLTIQPVGHSVSFFTCRLGDIEGLAFGGEHEAFGICRRCANSHLFRFDLKTRKCQYLGKLGFGALNLTARIPLSNRRESVIPKEGPATPLAISTRGKP